MMLSDAHWHRIAPLLPRKAGVPSRSGTDNRLFLEAVLGRVDPMAIILHKETGVVGQLSDRGGGPDVIDIAGI
jgi:hypothetical protein